MATTQIPIFVINLDRSPERLRKISERLRQLDLTYERVPAIEGATLTDAVRAGFNPKRLSHRYSDYAVACYLSHLRALAIISERAIPCGIVLEDDAVFDAGFKAWTEPAIPLPAGVEILKLEGFGAANSPKLKVSRYAGRTIQFSYKPSGGAAAYLITLEGARRALRELKIMRGLLDCDLFAYWRTGIGVHEADPFPVTQDGSPTTIIPPKSPRRPLVFRFARYLFKSRARIERAIYVARKFGFHPLFDGLKTQVGMAAAPASSRK
jgi:glycosyl transferase family 25